MNVDISFIDDIIKVQLDKLKGPAVREGAKWLDSLSDEDLVFIKRFVLASGSLKALAQAYGVSYPTVRLRVDRLIGKIRILDDQQIGSEFERTLRLLYAEGRIDMPTLKLLLSAHRKEAEGPDESAPGSA